MGPIDQPLDRKSKLRSLREQAAKIKKELAELSPQIEAERDRLRRAHSSRNDADMANILIAGVYERLGKAPQGASGTSALQRSDVLKKEISAIRQQIDEIEKNVKSTEER